MTTKAIISKNATEIETDILRLFKEDSISEEILFSGYIFFFLWGYYDDEIILYKDIMIAVNRVRNFILKKCKHW